MIEAYKRYDGQALGSDKIGACSGEGGEKIGEGEPRNGSKPPENLLNASSKPFQDQTSPPCWQCMNQDKNAKLST
jgi:hypothetical protein